MNRRFTVRHFTVCAAVASVGVAAALVPATSYAGSTTCGGRTAIGKSGITNDVEYRFACSTDIKGFTVITNTFVDELATTAYVFDRDTGAQVEKQSFDCDAAIPGVGVSCNGTAGAGKRVVGNFGLAKKRCGTLRVWLAVVDPKGAISGPFQLGRPKECRKSTGESKRRSRRR
jgi:hypothetical protein